MESISPNTRNKPKTEFDKDRQDEFLSDAIGDIKADQCEHTPDLLDHIGWDCRGDEVIHICRCACGKTVTEIFRHSVTEVSE